MILNYGLLTLYKFNETSCFTSNAFALNHNSNRKWDKKYIMKHAAAFRRLVTKGRFNFAKTDANYKVLIISNKYNVK